MCFWYLSRKIPEIFIFPFKKIRKLREKFFTFKIIFVEIFTFSTFRFCFSLFRLKFYSNNYSTLSRKSLSGLMRMRLKWDLIIYEFTFHLRLWLWLSITATFKFKKTQTQPQPQPQLKAKKVKKFSGKIKKVWKKQKQKQILFNET